jgi:hypothetical protein
MWRILAVLKKAKVIFNPLNVSESLNFTLEGTNMIKGLLNEKITEIE